MSVADVDQGPDRIVFQIPCVFCGTDLVHTPRSRRTIKIASACERLREFVLCDGCNDRWFTHAAPGRCLFCQAGADWRDGRSIWLGHEDRRVLMAHRTCFGDAICVPAELARESNDYRATLFDPEDAITTKPPAETPAGPSRSVMLDISWTNSFVEAVARGNEEARRRQLPTGTEHLLLGILCDPDDTLSPVLQRLGVSPDRLRQALEARLPRVQDAQTAEIQCGYTWLAARVLKSVACETLAVHQTAVRPQHLFLALVHERKGIAAGVLRDAGVTLDAARAAVSATSD